MHIQDQIVLVETTLSTGNFRAMRELRKKLPNIDHLIKLCDHTRFRGKLLSRSIRENNYFDFIMFLESSSLSTVYYLTEAMTGEEVVAVRDKDPYSYSIWQSLDKKCSGFFLDELEYIKASAPILI